jgi:hypothetical protein
MIDFSFNSQESIFSIHIDALFGKIIELDFSSTSYYLSLEFYSGD